jgi:hypothetical protein
LKRDIREHIHHRAADLFEYLGEQFFHYNDHKDTVGQRFIESHLIQGKRLEYKKLSWSALTVRERLDKDEENKKCENSKGHELQLTCLATIILLVLTLADRTVLATSRVGCPLFVNHGR